MTRLVVVNAVYFKGAWASAFDASRTALQPFTLSDGSQVQITTMNGTVNLREGSTPYRGDALAMDFLMPSLPGGLGAFESTLAPTVLSDALASLGAVQSAQLYLPRFSFRTSLRMPRRRITPRSPTHASCNETPARIEHAKVAAGKEARDHRP